MESAVGEQETGNKPEGHNGLINVMFDRPVIPPNTGNAIRMCAGCGVRLQLAGPLGFNLEEKHVKRAGLDYHDLADVTQHANFHEAFAALPDARIFAFSAHAEVWHTDIQYQPGDVLLFGPEPTGLGEDILSHPRITQQVRIPMLPGRRSMNLSNAAAVATYEAWRQFDFFGGE